MNNHTEQPALFVDPKTTMEMMQELKAHIPEHEVTLSTLEGFTNRDLLFYALGKVCGLELAKKLRAGEEQLLNKIADLLK